MELLELFSNTGVGKLQGPGTYYNTLSKSGNELKEKQNKVRGQTAEILSVFASNPQVEFTAWDIHDKLKVHPITSIRRTICNLNHPEKGQYIICTGQRISGPYNTESFTYKLNPNQI